jgi:hypothetical protein
MHRGFTCTTEQLVDTKWNWFYSGSYCYVDHIWASFSIVNARRFDLLPILMQLEEHGSSRIHESMPRWNNKLQLLVGPGIRSMTCPLFLTCSSRWRWWSDCQTLTVNGCLDLEGDIWISDFDLISCPGLADSQLLRDSLPLPAGCMMAGGQIVHSGFSHTFININ